MYDNSHNSKNPLGGIKFGNQPSFTQMSSGGFFILWGLNMPEGRIILKSIAQSKKMAALKTDGARLCYTWLIPHLDVRGCFSGDPAVINGQVMTRLGKNIETIRGYLEDMEANGLIVLYPANGDVFLYVPDFTDKQPKLRPEKEAKPRIPLPTPDQLRTKDVPTPPQVKESKGKESKKRYAEFVTLTEKEYNILIEKHGEPKTKKMIEVLDNYKGSTGKKYNSDYRAILSWVVDKVNKEWTGAPSPPKPNVDQGEYAHSCQDCGYTIIAVGQSKKDKRWLCKQCLTKEGEP